MKTLGLLLIACGVLVYAGLAASFIRASGYWPWTYMPLAGRSHRSLRLDTAAPVWVGVAWVCVICGAFVISDSNWVGIAIIGFCGVSQVAFVTWSQRQARRRATRGHARHLAVGDLRPDSPYIAARSRHNDWPGRQPPSRDWER